MGNAFQSLAGSRSLFLRFSPGRVKGGMVACLCLCVSAGMWAAPAAPEQAATAYRQAMDSFNKEEYSRALALLDHAPAAEKTGDQADVWNLRGAIYLHLHRYDQARTAFAKAIEKDPQLWAAEYNQAEVSFRQGKYVESSRQFEALLGRTNGSSHGDERNFLQYKLLLADLLAGKEKPVLDYLGEHRADKLQPLMYFYLNAALEQRRGHAQQAGQWLAQGDAHYSPAAEQVFAESFRSLGWFTERSDRMIAAARRHDASSTTPTAMAMVELIPGQQQPTPPPRPAALPVKALSPAPRENTPATTLPDAPKPTFRMTAPPSSAGDLEAAQMPPSAADDSALPQGGATGRQEDSATASTDAVQDADADPRAVYSRPVVLARPTDRSKPKTPAAPAASPAGSPSAGSGTANPTPAASPASAASPSPSGGTLPAATPAPAFLEKYEQAYIKFLGKDYPAAKTLLNEADAIQPRQPTAVTLRTQIFKHYYEAAYMVYKKADYAGAIEQLDEADSVQPNQPDALNLRGLTLSKQRDYEHAETAFKRAIQADPTFWAARFNYAELPFNYRNYTAARARFEELYSQTDASKQPREAELTQFKVFLTLLLEGKVDGARNFMSRFNFSGATPARYFCQSALEFYAGNMDKATAEIDQANKEYQPQLVAIFKESFFRIGWLSDPNNPGGAVAGGPPPVASPAGSPALATASPAAPTLAASTTGTPASSSAASPTPGVSPVVVAAASPMTLAETPQATPAASPVQKAAPNLASGGESATSAPARPAKISNNENLIRVLLIGFVLINFAYSTIRVFMAAMSRQPRRTLPVKRSPVYSGSQEEAEPDEVEAPR